MSEATLFIMPAEEATLTIETYKVYLIETFESSEGRYRARVRRLDGRKIKIPTDSNREVDSITTSGMAAFSVDGALKSAKEMIDGKRMM
jgi:hypothetical protein